MPEVKWLIHEIAPAKSTIEGGFCTESTGFTFGDALRYSECFPRSFSLFYKNMLLSEYVYTVASTREFHIDTARTNYRRAD